MMDDDRFNHHNYLSSVAAADVRFVLDRDRAYGASWKRSGGRSAWYMLVRKMDRLAEMLRPPEPPDTWDLENARKIAHEHDSSVTIRAPHARYLIDSLVSDDIFAKIAANPSGDDGTALAEVRDLRRYLLLVEAEMVARGVVAPSSRPNGIEKAAAALNLTPDVVGDLFGKYHDEAPEPRDDVEMTVPPSPGTGSVTAMPGTGNAAATRPVPAEDSNRHADRSVLSTPEWLWVTGDVHRDVLSARERMYYRMYGTGWTLREHVIGHVLAARSAIREMYVWVTINQGEQVGWLLNRSLVPRDIELVPALRTELNTYELKQLSPPIYRALYEWHQSGTKYVIRPEYADWVR